MVLVGSILVRLRLSSGIHKGESLTSNNKNWKMTDAKGMVFKLFDLRRGRLMYNVIRAPMIFYIKNITSLLIKLMYVLSLKRQIIIEKQIPCPNSPHLYI